MVAIFCSTVCVLSIPTLMFGLVVLTNRHRPLSHDEQRAVVWSMTTAALGGTLGVVGLLGLTDHLPWMGFMFILSVFINAVTVFKSLQGKDA